MLLRSRIHALDAVRGAAMLFVCLVHFSQIYFLADPSSTTSTVLGTLGKIASPTFVILSGVLLGLLYHSKRLSFERIRDLFIDRAILLLTVGHLLIAIAFFVRFRSWEMVFGINYVTDLLAVCMIFGVATIRGTRPVERLVASMGIYALAMLLLAAWHPVARDWQVLHDRLVGSMHMNTRSDGFALLPWLAVYYASSALGEWMGRALQAGERLKLERVTLTLGIGGILFAVLAKLAWWSLDGAALADPSGILAVLSSPWRKQPPSPVYLLFFGGLGLTMAAMVFTIERRQLLTKATAALSLLGRNSLFVFIVQFHVYFVVFYLARFPMRGAWPLWFAASLGFILLVCKAWDDRGGNRFLTVRYGYLRHVLGHSEWLARGLHPDREAPRHLRLYGAVEPREASPPRPAASPGRVTVRRRNAAG